MKRSHHGRIRIDKIEIATTATPRKSFRGCRVVGFLVLLFVALVRPSKAFAPSSPRACTVQRANQPEVMSRTSSSYPRLRASSDQIEKEEGASIPNLSISLVKSIVGAGVLALPAGFAAVGNSPDTVSFSCLLVVLIGMMNAYFFSLIGRVCNDTGAKTYLEAWETTVGTESGPLIAWTVTLKTVLSCLGFQIVLTDSIQSLALAAGLEGLSRGQALLGVTLFPLLPLCFLRDISSLAPFSLLGLGGVLFTAISMIIRLFDQSYASRGQFISDLAVQPCFGDDGPNWDGVILCSTLATAFVAHYNAPRFFSELQDNSVQRFNQVIGYSFLLSGVAFMAVATAGFLTFGASSQGFILNNYSPYDLLISSSRAALAFSIAMTYPLPFVGLRDGTLDLMDASKTDRDNPFYVNAVSVGLLAFVTTLAYFIQDLGLVLSVGGGTFSTAVSSMFPAIMFSESQRKSNDKGVYNLETQFALGLMVLATGIGGTGVVLALNRAFGS